MMTKPDTPFPRHWRIISRSNLAHRRRRCAGAEAVRHVVNAMAQALPKPALRPFLPADTPLLAAIFAASILELTGDDYSEVQQGAWAAAAEDEEAFGKRLASQLTLIATLQNSPVGFASLKGPDHIDMLFVHPGAAGQGVGAMLCDALEKLAGARGAKSLTVDASDTALDFFREARLCRQAAQFRDPSTANGSPTPRCRRRWPMRQRREFRHEPRTPLSVRYHAARRRADQRRRLHAA